MTAPNTLRCQNCASDGLTPTISCGTCGHPHDVVLCRERDEVQAGRVPTDCVIVQREPIEWLKEKFPALCEKSGLCERVGGRLYTRTRLPMTPPPAQVPAGGVVADTIARLKFKVGDYRQMLLQSGFKPPRCVLEDCCNELSDAAVLLAAQQPVLAGGVVTDEVAWLIEAQGPAYLGPQDDGILGWTHDAGCAIRFARELDAQRYIDLEGLTGANAVEHMWCAQQQEAAHAHA